MVHRRECLRLGGPIGSVEERKRMSRSNENGKRWHVTPRLHRNLSRDWGIIDTVL